MKTHFGIIAFFSLLTVNIFSQTDVFQSNKLTEIWKVEGLNVPESVMPLPEENDIYVSNIGGSSADTKDTNGFISKLSLDGKIISLKWAVGLNAPKGMGILDKSLFVTDIDQIVEIDLRSGKIKKFYPIKGSQFLNDIVITSDGTLYITDSRLGMIYKMKNGAVSEFIQSKDFPFANGITLVDTNLLLGTGAQIVSIGLKSGKINKTYENTGGVDGLDYTGAGNLIFSDWTGKTSIMTPGKEKELLLDTSKKEKCQSADFGYMAEKNLIFVPTFFGNSVVCYELKE